MHNQTSTNNGSVRKRSDLTPAMKATGARVGTGVPFATLYMTRTTKKHAVLTALSSCN